MDQQFRNVTYLSDRSGTGCWRVVWPINSVNCISQDTGIQADYSQTPILDANFYNGMTSATIQRWISNQQKDIFEKFLMPLSERNHFHLIYEEDDDMLASHIPLYNRGRAAFESPEIQANIKYMLQNSDMVTVTTDYIREIYNKYYEVPLEKIVAIPNLLPRYLYGDRYDKDKKLNQFKHYKNKPRIGIVSSLSHYNIDNVREDENGKACRLREATDPNTKQPLKDEKGEIIKRWINQDNVEVPEEKTRVILDDLDIILDCIRETVDEVQWVFFGFAPPKLKDLIDKRKIEIHGGVPIMNYCSQFDNLQLQSVVAPIIDMEFNRCKSFIKYMECAALGVPLFASRCLPYNRVMDDSQMFSTGDELKEMIRKLKFMSSGSYEKTIEKQWKWLNTPCKEGDFNIRNFWLEDNLNIYVDKYRMRPKTIPVSMDFYFKRKEEEEQKRKQNTIFSNDNGVEILR